MENKERKKINQDLIVLAVAAVVVLVLFICFRIVTGFLIQSIDAEDVGSIILKVESGARIQLDEDQMKEFAKIYNSSNYYGKERNFDTTPLYDFTIEFKDGKTMKVSEFGYLFVVTWWEDEKAVNLFHITNDDMDAFVEKAYNSKD